MKKLIPFLCIMTLLVTSISALAQTKFSLGIKAGPNFSNINTEKSATTNYNSRTGFHGGAFALFRFTKFGIQPEILFSQQGSKFTVNQQDFKSNYSYMNIPIIVKLYTVAGINLQVGPQFGFLTTAESNYDPSTQTPFSSTRDVKDAYKKSDFSLALGAGWDLPFGLTIDGRYNLGLSDINSGAGGTVRNQVWQVSVGYKLFTLGE
jgi:hypothetical protein